MRFVCKTSGPTLSNLGSRSPLPTDRLSQNNIQPFDPWT